MSPPVIFAATAFVVILAAGLALLETYIYTDERNQRIRMALSGRSRSPPPERPPQQRNRHNSNSSTSSRSSTNSAQLISRNQQSRSTNNEAESISNHPLRSTPPTSSSRSQTPTNNHQLGSASRNNQSRSTNEEHRGLFGSFCALCDSIECSAQFLPCGHYVLCEDCARAFQSKIRECPTPNCHRFIESISYY